MRCRVIYNPKSGRHAAQRKLEQILGKLVMSEGESAVEICPTAGVNDARRFAAEAKAADCDFIIGAGGDGTFNEIVNGLMDSGSGLPLAMLPGGTVNDFAYHLHLPTESAEFYRMLRQGRQRQVDLGWANGRYFVNVAAFGMFADVAFKTKNRDKSVLGKMAYYLQGMLDIPEQLFSSMQLQATCDGKSFDSEALVCIIANSSSVAGARNFINKARVDDGLLDMFLLRKLDAPSLGETLQNLLSGDGLRSGFIEQRQIGEASFQILDDKQVELDLDGEAFGALPLTVRVAPKALRLFVPDFETQWRIKGKRLLLDE